jgi:hypothetical protein
LNRIRPAGAEAMIDLPLTVDGVADGYAKLFRARVEVWGDGWCATWPRVLHPLYEPGLAAPAD